MPVVFRLVKATVFTVTVAFILSCNGRSDGASLCLDEVVSYADVNPVISLDSHDSGHAFNLPVGLLDVMLWKDYLLLATRDGRGFITVFNKQTGETLGQFLLKGNGPAEILWPVFFSGMSFSENGASIFKEGGTVLEWDVDESCRQKNSVCTSQEWNLRPAITMASFIRMGETEALCKEFDKGLDCQIRYIWRNGERIILPAQEKLNGARLSTKDGGNINILSGLVAYHPERELVVEASVMLNTIQLYSLDGHLAKTLCVGHRPDVIADIEALSEEKLPISFKSLRLYEDRFAVLYYGTTELEYALQKRVKPVILVFDWEGALLSSYQVPVRITSFDIDWIDGIIYAVNHDDDAFYCFKLPED